MKNSAVWSSLSAPPPVSGSVAHAAGKATFTQVCAECHEVADFEGEDAAEVQATIKKIVGGTIEHEKPPRLTRRTDRRRRGVHDRRRVNRE